MNNIPETWRNWIKENLERGCNPEHMIVSMTDSKAFTEDQARQALGQIDNIEVSPVVTQAPNSQRPYIETTENLIQLPDRTVSLLFKLANPNIVLLDNVLSSEECDELVEQANSRFEQSKVVDPNTGQSKLHEGRTSQGAMFQRSETELIKRIEERLSYLVHWPMSHCEGLQLQKYGPGNEYRPHHDWFDPAYAGSIKHTEHGGQRNATVILYLSDVEAGGSTSFPNIGVDVYPKKGSAVFFANTDAYGNPVVDTLHAGAPVVRGVKIIANKWLRVNKF